MNDVPGLPPVGVDADISAPVSELVESGEATDQSQQAFDDALDDSGQTHASQTPQTRKAIKQSLDRLQNRSAPAGTPQQTSREPGVAGQQSPAVSGLRAPGTEASSGLPERDEMPAGAGMPGVGGTTSAGVDRSEGEVRGLAGSTRSAGSSTSGRLRGTELSASAGSTPAIAHGAEADNANTVSSGSPATAMEDLRSIAPAAAPTTGSAKGSGQPLAAVDPGRAQGVTESTATPGSASAASGPSAAHARTAAPNRSGTGVSRQEDPGVDAREIVGRRASGGRKESAAPRQSVDRGSGTAVEESAARPSVTDFVSGRQPDQAPRESGTSMRGSRTAAAERMERGEGADSADVQPSDMTGLATPSGVPEPGSVAGPESAEVPASRAAELAEQVADRILVSIPKSGSGGEVRVSLKESVLDGSDVRIFREAGELRVVFIPQTASAGQFLADNRSVLQQTLGERLQDERVHVEIEPSDRGDASGQDSEGRSRQRYVPQDDPSEATRH